MLAYIARRVVLAVPLLVAVLFAAFALLYALPGDPTHALLGNQWTPEAAQRIRQAEGLDDPLVVQFGRYLRDVVHGNLGTNQQKKPVAEELKTRLPATIELALAAMVIATVIGLSMGIFSALRPRGLRDLTALTISLAGVSLPIFWLGLMAKALFRHGGVISDWTGLAGLPQGGRLSEAAAQRIEQQLLHARYVANAPLHTTGFHVIDAIFVFHDKAMILDALQHLALPALVLASVPTAMIMRITRTTVGEQLGQDYVRTARAKGLPWRTIVLHHALRNAAIAIVTSIGTQLGYLLGGAVLTETIFSWPGLGKYIVDAILVQDARPLQAGVLVIAVGFIVINLLVDLSYAMLDPRVRIAD